MKNTLILIAVAIITFLFILLIIKLSGNSKEDADNQNPNIEDTAPDNSQPANDQQTPVNTGKQKTTYYFSDYPNGKVTVYVSSITTFYPIGGEIKFQTPSGKIFKYLPGEKMNFYEPQGNYTFWSENSSAYAVEIWQ